MNDAYAVRNLIVDSDIELLNRVSYEARTSVSPSICLANGFTLLKMTAKLTVPGAHGHEH